MGRVQQSYSSLEISDDDEDQSLSREEGNLPHYLDSLSSSYYKNPETPCVPDSE